MAGVIIWRGKGLFVVLFFFAGLFLVDWLTGVLSSDPQFWSNNDWVPGSAMALAGLLTWLFARKFCPTNPRRLLDEDTGEVIVQIDKHSLFFIPIRAWAVILPLFGVFLTFYDSSPDSPEYSTSWNSRLFEEELAAPAPTEPTLFAAGLLSDGMDQRDSTLSFDQQLFLYTLKLGRQARIMTVVLNDGHWQKPRTATFSGTWRDLEATFKPGSFELYFVSDRPLPGETEAGDFNIWVTTWAESAWTEPQPVEDLNRDGHEFYPSLTTDGDLYYTATQEGGVGGEDIWFAKAKSDGSGFLPPVALGPGVNTAGGEFNAAIDPTGNYLIFGAAREDGPGGGDLYLSKRGETGNWQEGVLLGSEINTERLDFCPFFFGEEGEIWFTSQRFVGAPSANAGLRALRKVWQQPGNGLGDLYRVKLDLK